MSEVVAHIVNPVDVNRRLMDMERARGAQILRFTLLMERAESWTVDDIRTDSTGFPVAISDDRGTAEERLQGVTLLEDLLNSPKFAQHLRRSENDSEFTDFDERLIDVMALMRTSRFVVCLNYMSSISGSFIANWLGKVDQRATVGNVLAHVLRERLAMLQRANLIRAVFSRASVEQVIKTLGVLK